jgi:hypothetical protein
MSNRSLKAYVESMREKAAEKAKVEIVPDYKGPSPSSPSFGKTPKDSGGKGQSGKVSPYKGGKDAPNPNKSFSDGLAHKGDKGYQKTYTKAHGEKEKVIASYPKITTQEWLDRTKKLSLAEFTKKIRKDRLSGIESNPSAIYESIKETMSVCEKNKRYILDTVLEMKRSGLFESFFATMAQQPEAFDVLAKLMESTNYSRQFVDAINEMVAPPIDSDHHMGSKRHRDDDMSYDDDHEMSDDDHDEEDHDEEDHDEDHDEEDHEMSDDDLSDDDHDEDDHDEDDHDEDDDDLSDDDDDYMDDNDMDSDDEYPDRKRVHMDDEGMKDKGSAPANLINAMKNSPMMKRMMRKW